MRHLGHDATMITYSPKLGRITTLVGDQMLAAELAESRIDIQGYSFPGPELEIDNVAASQTRQLLMSVVFKNGTAGAFDLLSPAEESDALCQCLEEASKHIGLRLELFNAKHFADRRKHYSAWRQLVRHIHPKTRPGTLPLCIQVRELVSEGGHISLSDIAKRTKAEIQTTLSVTAHLIHNGDLLFDSPRGSFDLQTKVWRPT